MCGSIVYIQSGTAETRRGTKRKKKKKIEETTGQKYNGLPYSIKGGEPQSRVSLTSFSQRFMVAVVFWLLRHGLNASTVCANSSRDVAYLKFNFCHTA